MNRMLVIFTLISLINIPPDVQAQGLRGMVVDSATGKAVPAATVMVYEGRRVIVDLKSDSAGAFNLPVAAQIGQVLHVTALGFDPLTIRMQPNSGPVTVRLQPAPVAVEGVSVTAERRDPFLNLTGFYQRKRAEIGTFIDREQIDKRNPHRVTDLFQGVAGARIIPRGSSYEVVTRRFTGGPATGAVCLPAVYLDGVPVGRGGLNDLILPENLLGVEAYMSASRVPAQYGGANAACGVILLWTRLKS